MKKTVGDAKASLEALRLEFEAFRRGVRAVPVSKPGAPGRPKFENDLPDVTLYCSKKIGERSSLRLRVGGSSVEVVAAEIAARCWTDSAAGKTGGAPIQKRVLELSSSYCGCPHCGGKGIARCSNCGVLGCWSDSEQHLRCAVCGQTAVVERTGIVISLAYKAGEFKSLRSKLKQVRINPAKRLLPSKRTPED
ncbi:putative RNA-binding Zn-ribbon protein involved in translation (DUF1610 family) [Caballeronia udeis]|uniref:RNA-binding Zn-ribbon protein involved in translation (DUF1610 family) n=1 Tax=Caballeronia udeis TaxID=1232866 RepID=A0ABW8MR28_9BURK